MKIRTYALISIILLINLALILAVFMFPGNVVQIILAAPFLLFSPGYVILIALFPQQRALGNVFRILVSLALSLAIIPLICFILYLTPWGIRQDSVVGGISVVVLVGSIAAWLRLRSQPEIDRFEFEISYHAESGQSRINRVIFCILLVVLLASVGTAVYVIRMPRGVEGYTEFYLLGPAKEINKYPQAIAVGGKGEVTLVFVNHEMTTTDYTFEISIEGKESYKFDSITLSSEQRYQKAVAFYPSEKGNNQTVEFLLYKNGQTNAYLSLHLLIDVQ